MRTRTSIDAAGNTLLPPGARNAHAKHLFDGIAHSYDRPAQIYSLFRYLNWRRFLVSRLNLNHTDLVLDVATGPGGVAGSIAGQTGCRVIGVDLSREMLQQAQSNLGNSGLTPLISLVNARGEDLPFPDRSFNAVVFTFLFRYVDDPRALLKELARVLKPGGQIATLEFYVPSGPVLHPLWLAHTRLVMPWSMRFISPGWKEVGNFLGPNISAFFHKYSLEDLTGMWTQAGLSDVRTRVLSQGGAFVMWGRKEAR